MTTTELPNITLYYREGSSDKVYQCQIEPAGERFVVNFSYGRRGSALNSGTKTNVPVDLASAQRIFDKLVKEKRAKGYTEGESGTPYQHSEQQPAGTQGRSSDLQRISLHFAKLYRQPCADRDGAKR